MKKRILILSVMMFSIANALAVSKASSPDYRSVIHKGIKLSLDVSSTRITSTSTQKDEAGNNKENLETSIYSANTFTIGYQSIAPRKWGYTVLLERTRLTNSETDYTLYLDMLEGNATFGLSDKWYMSFGGNISRYNSSESEINSKIFEKIAPGLGTQFAFGFQPNRYLGLEAKLIITSHTAEVEYTDGVSGDIQFLSSAFRLGVGATF